MGSSTLLHKYLYAFGNVAFAELPIFWTTTSSIWMSSQPPAASLHCMIATVLALTEPLMFVKEMSEILNVLVSQSPGVTPPKAVHCVIVKGEALPRSRVMSVIVMLRIPAHKSVHCSAHLLEKDTTHAHCHRHPHLVDSHSFPPSKSSHRPHTSSQYSSRS